MNLWVKVQDVNISIKEPVILNNSLDSKTPDCRVLLDSDISKCIILASLQILDC